MHTTTTPHGLGGALRARRSLLIAALVTVVLDVAVKIWTVNQLATDSVQLGPLTLKLVHNYGVAFGLGGSVPSWARLLVTGGVTVLLGVMAWRGVLIPQFAAGMIVAGAACNAVDRAIGGSVIDTFSLTFFPPVFNVADAALDIGLVIVIVAMFFPQRDDDPSADAGPPADDGASAAAGPATATGSAAEEQAQDAPLDDAVPRHP